MTLNNLYDVVYKLQERENFARGLCVCISREAFATIHKECARRGLHTSPGPRFFLELNIDGVAVIWSACLKGDLYFTGAESVIK